MTWKNLLDKLLNVTKWTKIFWLVIFLLMKWVLNLIINIVMLIQTLIWFWTGETLDKLVTFSSILNNYLLQIVEFLTFRSGTLPWPIGDLPKQEVTCLEKK